MIAFSQRYRCSNLKPSGIGETPIIFEPGGKYSDVVVNNRKCGLFGLIMARETGRQSKRVLPTQAILSQQWF